ncbi:adenylyl-sulfate kinase [Telmatospirillum sp.]|uniref:adenylyl-sulfate kinase n=1 Tax=Telmatospirillum sp. TaxID=2079197 RepID=UPI00283C3D5A|nr:adenylyl-sulfate kinase [Telmatospirillum sp.]MDR3438446.1 adenylyl-sulfate kinase [Telmatospirillum sp.]
MVQPDSATGGQLDALLRRQGSKPALRFMTCGSVDDGKSTLIGRLLYDSQMLLDDQLQRLQSDSRAYGTTGDDFDFALLLDGLQAEREQGITIDVAYRFFATERRRFIVADTPGHEQYTRNMATGASTADLAVVLVDARKGVVTQTRRHTNILGLFGIRHVLLAVNKMDLVAFDAERFAAIVTEFSSLARRLGIDHVTCVPVSAAGGDNIFSVSQRMPWYDGPTIMDHLETVEVSGDRIDRPFRLPVQWVNRSHDGFRGYCGRVAGGSIAVGDPVTVYPSGQKSRVAALLTAAGKSPRVQAGQSITVLLADEIDVGRGDVLASGVPLVATRLSAHLLWLDEQPMMPGSSYLMRCGTRDVGATISALDHRIDIDSLEQLDATTLALNDIGCAQLSLDQPLVCDVYRDSREMGGFILIDRFSHRTAAAGMIDRALRRAADLPWQQIEITKSVRARLKAQRPCVLWFTGLSGAGKSTIANLVDKRLFAVGRHCYLLDGDNLRHGLNHDLGFGDDDRRENMRRTAEVAKLFVDAGLIVLVALISPFRRDRDMVRASLGPDEFVEIHVATPLTECERRDPKGHYRRAHAGDLAGFTGVDSPYEPPEKADLVLDTMTFSAEQAADQVIAFLRAGRYI